MTLQRLPQIAMNQVNKSGRHTATWAFDSKNMVNGAGGQS